MKNSSKTKQALIEEISDLKKKVQELEQKSSGKQLEKRELSEHEIRQAKQDFHLLFREMLEGFALHQIICNEQGQPIDYHFLTVNPAFERITGLSAGDIVGKTVLEVMPDTERHWIETYGRVALTGEPVLFEDYSKVLDKYFAVTAFQPVSNQFACIFVDITDRKRAEESLCKSEHRFRELVELAVDGILLGSPEGVIIDANSSALRILGIEKDVLLGKPIQEIFSPRVLDEKPLRFDLLIQGKTVVTEREVTRPDGKLAFIEMHSKKMPSGSYHSIIRDITERKQAEENLRARHARHQKEQEFSQLIFDTSPAFIVAIGFDGRTLMMNQSLLAALEYTPDQIRGTDYLETFVPEEDRPAAAAIFLQLNEERKVTISENRIISKSGKIYLVEWHGRNAVGGERDSGFFVGIGIDITGRKRTEEQLRRANVFLDSIIEYIPNMVFIKDAQDLRFIRFNRAGEELLGYPRADMLGKNDHDFFPREQADFFTEKDRQVLSGKEVLDIPEESLNTRDRGVRILHTRKVPILDTEGKAEYLLGVSEDITERKQAELALKESEEKFRRFMESSPIAIMLHQNNKWIYANKVATEISGYAIQELHSMNFWEFIHPDDRQMIQEKGWKRQRGEEPANRYECKIISKDGALKWVDVSGALVFIDGSPAVIVSFMDITFRKQAEQEQEKLQRQLNQAQKMESVGRLAGGVAHDFNNMLGVILGHAEMALNNVNTTHSLYANLIEIRQAAERSADLTRQLLAFARKQTIAPKVLDMNNTVQGMLKMLRRLIGEDIDLIWLPGKNLWQVKMDPSQIDQILANLCINARDAIDEMGKITIETATTSFDEYYCEDHAGVSPGDYVLITVSDNGCGMDKETLEKLFEPFFTTKSVGLGTGLGLATVYGIVKQNNGFINVDSVPGRGTTFKVYLSRYVGKSDQIQTKGSAKPVEQGHEIILLVEDERTILDMTKIMLETLGYTVLAAATPGDAIRLAQTYAGEIHLLMTDVIMPEMNGKDLARKLLSLYPDIKRLFMSGYTADIIAHHGVLDEGVNFIQKPFLMKNLATKLRETLKNG